MPLRCLPPIAAGTPKRNPAITIASTTTGFREQAAAKDHRWKEVAILEANNTFCDPVEEASQVEVSNDQHHREQQDDGREIDCPQHVLGALDPKATMSTAPMMAAPGRSIFRSRKFPQCEYTIAAKENEVGRKYLRVGENKLDPSARSLFSAKPAQAGRVKRAASVLHDGTHMLSGECGTAAGTLAEGVNINLC